MPPILSEMQLFTDGTMFRANSSANAQQKPVFWSIYRSKVLSTTLQSQMHSIPCKNPVYTSLQSTQPVHDSAVHKSYLAV